MPRRRPLLAVLTAAYLALVGWITLGPQPLDERGQGLLRRVLRVLDGFAPTSWIDYPTVEFGANVALFAPLGLGFVLLLGARRWWLAVLLGVALTCGIEFAQQFLPTRVPDPRDLLANGIGTGVGVLCGALLARRRPAAP